MPIAAPVAALIGAHYAGAAFGLSDPGRLALASGVLAVGLVANARGIRTAGWVQPAVVCGIAAILLLAVPAAAPRVQAARFVPFAPQGWTAVARAAALLFWCFIGWEAVTYLSGAFLRPERDLVPAVLWSVALVSALYLATAAVTVGTGSYGPGGRTEAGLVGVLEAAVGTGAARLAGVTALLCVTATTNAYMGAAAQLARELARAGAAPAAFARTHPVRGTPVGGLAFLAGGFALTLLLVGAGAVGFRDLVALPTASFLATYVLGCAAGVRLADMGIMRLLAALALAASLTAYPFLG